MSPTRAPSGATLDADLHDLRHRAVGFGSPRIEELESSTVGAGLHASFRTCRQRPPMASRSHWQIFVEERNFDNCQGSSDGKLTFRKKMPLE